MFKKKKNLSIKIIIMIFFIGVISFIITFTKSEKKYHETFPLKFNYTNMPTIEIKIDKNNYWIGIDLGYNGHITLEKAILNNIKKVKPKKSASIINFKGNKYLFSCFEISKIEIGNFKFKKIKVDQENDDFDQSTNLGTFLPTDGIKRIERKGIIGMGLLKGYNLLFDFQNMIFGISNDKEELKKIGYDFNNFVKVPFEMSPFGILINVDSELGLKTFLLDTGFTLSSLKKYPCLEKMQIEKNGRKMINVSNFIIGNENFNSQDLLLIDLGDYLMNIDGILGISFLKEHASYIDFKNKILYLKK